MAARVQDLGKSGKVVPAERKKQTERLSCRLLLAGFRVSDGGARLRKERRTC